MHSLRSDSGGDFAAAPGGQQLRVCGHERWDSRANPRNIKNKHAGSDRERCQSQSRFLRAVHTMPLILNSSSYTRSPASSLETVTCALSEQPRISLLGVCSAAPLHSPLVHSAAPRPHGNITGWVKNACARSCAIHYIMTGGRFKGSAQLVVSLIH